jgi:hypothetical protein
VALEQLDQHLFLAREIEVERAFRDARGFGELVHAGERLRAAAEQALGGVEDLAPALELVFGAHCACLGSHGRLYN